jgi:hypothetical protein
MRGVGTVVTATDERVDSLQSEVTSVQNKIDAAVQAGGNPAGLKRILVRVEADLEKAKAREQLEYLAQPTRVPVYGLPGQ